MDRWRDKRRRAAWGWRCEACPASADLFQLSVHRRNIPSHCQCFDRFIGTQGSQKNRAISANPCSFVHCFKNSSNFKSVRFGWKMLINAFKLTYFTNVLACRRHLQQLTKWIRIQLHQHSKFSWTHLQNMIIWQNNAKFRYNIQYFIFWQLLEQCTARDYDICTKIRKYTQYNTVWKLKYIAGLNF